jgi:hypothetical protein
MTGIPACSAALMPVFHLMKDIFLSAEIYFALTLTKASALEV